MQWLFNRASEILFSKEIKTSFDTLSSEATETTNINIFSGIKTEISKTLFPFLQLSKVSLYGQSQKMYQLFGTMGLQNSIFQISTDRDKNIQLRGSCMTGNFVSKFNTIISQNKEIFSQIEIDLRKKYNNFCLKMIQPAIKGTDLIYVFNFMQQMGSFAIGAEVIGSKSFLGLTLAGRHENTDSISTISIHQFNSLNFSYFRKINRLLNAGFNISYSKSYPLCYGIGLMMKSRKCEIKTCLNNEKKILFSYEDKLTEGLSISANCEFSKNTLDYGYGMGYEF